MSAVLVDNDITEKKYHLLYLYISTLFKRIINFVVKLDVDIYNDIERTDNEMCSIRV